MNQATVNAIIATIRATLEPGRKPWLSVSTPERTYAGEVHSLDTSTLVLTHAGNFDWIDLSSIAGISARIGASK